MTATIEAPPWWSRVQERVPIEAPLFAGAPFGALTLATYTLDVTEEDIRLGIPSDSSHCPLALAARRAGLEAQVGRQAMTVDVPEKVLADAGLPTESYYRLTMELDDSLREFVRRVDAREPVQPFQYRLAFWQG